jgi:hypothetical protein
VVIPEVSVGKLVAGLGDLALLVVDSEVPAGILAEVMLPDELVLGLDEPLCMLIGRSVELDCRCADPSSFAGARPRWARARAEPERPERPGWLEARICETRQYSTRMWSWTSVTPGAVQAADTASSCSAHELTGPSRVTVPFDVETERSSASSLALRLNALRMSSLTAWAFGACLPARRYRWSVLSA